MAWCVTLYSSATTTRINFIIIIIIRRYSFYIIIPSGRSVMRCPRPIVVGYHVPIKEVSKPDRQATADSGAECLPKYLHASIRLSSSYQSPGERAFHYTINAPNYGSSSSGASIIRLPTIRVLSGHVEPIIPSFISSSQFQQHTRTLFIIINPCRGHSIILQQEYSWLMVLIHSGGNR